MTARPPVSRKKFADMWCNTTIPASELARIFNRRQNHIYVMAKAWGLPDRKQLRHSFPRKVSRDDHAAIGKMWDAGVLGREIAAHFGVSDVSMRRIFREIGKPPRKQGFRPIMTLAEYFQADAIAKMRSDAVSVKAQWQLAEMVDGAARTGRWAA